MPLWKVGVRFSSVGKGDRLVRRPSGGSSRPDDCPREGDAPLLSPPLLCQPQLTEGVFMACLHSTPEILSVGVRGRGYR